MRLQLIRHLWGVPGKWEDLFPQFRELGFVGIEAPVPPASQGRRFRLLLAQHRLEYIPQIFTTGRNVATMWNSSSTNLVNWLEFGENARPHPSLSGRGNSL